MKYDIYNPTVARRIIHTGVEGSRPVEVLPHTTKNGVELADHIAKDLLERSQADRDGELRLTEASPEGEEGGPTLGIKLGLDEDKVHIIKAEDQPEAKKSRSRR